MKKIFYLLIISAVIHSSNLFAQAALDTANNWPQNKTDETTLDEPVFTVVEQMPVFPGGENAMNEFLSKNIKYPASAIKNGVHGTVYVSFIVEKDGTITNVNALRPLREGCTEEAIRVVRSMPAWTPGKQNGKNVRVQYNLPIHFMLNDTPAEKK